MIRDIKIYPNRYMTQSEGKLSSLSNDYFFIKDHDAGIHILMCHRECGCNLQHVECIYTKYDSIFIKNSGRIKVYEKLDITNVHFKRFAGNYDMSRYTSNYYDVNRAHTELILVFTSVKHKNNFDLKSKLTR